MKRGIKQRINYKVNQCKLATTQGSGDLEVLATPALIASLEEASRQAVAPYLSENSTTVGGYIEVTHMKPTAEGETYYVESVLTDIDRSKLTFELSAFDKSGQIGKGTHVRFVVNRDKFMSNISK